MHSSLFKTKFPAFGGHSTAVRETHYTQMHPTESSYNIEVIENVTFCISCIRKGF
jgi:hypothetical protein